MHTRSGTHSSKPAKGGAQFEYVPLRRMGHHPLYGTSGEGFRHVLVRRGLDALRALAVLEWEWMAEFNNVSTNDLFSISSTV